MMRPIFSEDRLLERRIQASRERWRFDFQNRIFELGDETSTQVGLEN